MSQTIDFADFDRDDAQEFIYANIELFGDDRNGFEGFIDDSRVTVIAETQGFVVTREMDDELAILYIYAAQPGKGIGTRLLQQARQINPAKRSSLLCHGEERMEWFAGRGFKLWITTATKGKRMRAAALQP